MTTLVRVYAVYTAGECSQVTRPDDHENAETVTHPPPREKPPSPPPDPPFQLKNPLATPIFFLPAELLTMILSPALLSEPDLISCCLVSRTFFAFAHPALYAHIRIGITFDGPNSTWAAFDPDSGRLVRALLDRPELAARVQSLTVQMSSVDFRQLSTWNCNAWREYVGRPLRKFRFNDAWLTGTGEDAAFFDALFALDGLAVQDCPLNIGEILWPLVHALPHLRHLALRGPLLHGSFPSAVCASSRLAFLRSFSIDLLPLGRPDRDALFLRSLALPPPCYGFAALRRLRLSRLPISPDAQSIPRTHRLIGMPLHGTYAPFLHNTITRLAGVPRKYTKWESTDLDAFMEYLRSEECGGSAVTMPHKVAICERLDDLTEDGRNIGACNTVIIRKGPNGERKLVGHNTDSVGVRESLLRADDSHVKSGKTRPGAVLGAGGACRAAVYALDQWLNCSPIYVVNRDDAEVKAFISAFEKNATETFKPKLVHVKTVEEAEGLEAPAYIVSAVPAFPPTTPEEKQARAVSEVFFNKPEKGVILEMCYHPDIWTELAQIAKDAGWNVVTGEQAMIWQGIEQQLLWLECEEKDLPIQEILDTVANQVASDKKTGSEPPQE
ncbi:hypothetical protein JCM10207_006818 [Rhodosporidiobolus poonsookiae]